MTSSLALPGNVGFSWLVWTFPVQLAGPLTVMCQIQPTTLLWHHPEIISLLANSCKLPLNVFDQPYFSHTIQIEIKQIYTGLYSKQHDKIHNNVINMSWCVHIVVQEQITCYCGIFCIFPFTFIQISINSCNVTTPSPLTSNF